MSCFQECRHPVFRFYFSFFKKWEDPELVLTLEDSILPRFAKIFAMNRKVNTLGLHVRRCLCTPHTGPVNRIHPLFGHPDLAPQHLASDPIRFENVMMSLRIRTFLFSSNCRAGWCSASSRCCLESAGGGSLLESYGRNHASARSLYLIRLVILFPARLVFFLPFPCLSGLVPCRRWVWLWNPAILDITTMTLTNQHEGVKELTVLISSSAITMDVVLLFALLSLLLVSTRTLQWTLFLNASLGGGAAGRFFITADVMSLNLPSRPRRKQEFTRFYLLNYQLN